MLVGLERFENNIYICRRFKAKEVALFASQVIVCDALPVFRGGRNSLIINKIAQLFGGLRKECRGFTVPGAAGRRSLPDVRPEIIFRTSLPKNQFPLRCPPPVPL